MEKLIHILPKLITNEDTQWLRKIVKDPDDLTRFIVEHFNTKLYRLSIMKRASFKYDSYGNEINDNTSIEDLINAVEKHHSENQSFAKLLEELNSRIDCNGKSASSILWASSILNNLEGHNINQNIISEAFFTVLSTMSESEKNINDLRNELLTLVENDKKLEQIANTSLVSSLIMNPNVQESNIFYDFNTFTKIENDTSIEIKSKQDLFDALYDLDNYNACIEYIKNVYLNEIDPTLDGFCENDNHRTYKALIIAAALASETYKHDDEFDKDNNIGHNLVADIYKLRRVINKEHIYSEITNKVNGLEYSAGRIASEILGRELEVAKKQDRIFNLPKSQFKTGNAEDYIKNNLNAFGKLIKPNLDYTLDLLNTIKTLKKKYQAKAKYRKSERTEETINFLAKELNVEFIPNETISPKEQLMQKLDILENVCDNRHRDLSRIEDIYKQVKTKQKTNLDIENVEFDKKLLGKNVALKTDLHEKAIKEFFKLVELDKSISIKGDKNEKLLLLSPKMILAKLKKIAASNKKELPTINDLYNHFRITPADMIKNITTGYYANNDGSVNKEYADLYKKLNDKTVDKYEKAKIIEEAELSEEDKEALNKSL